MVDKRALLIGKLALVITPVVVFLHDGAWGQRSTALAELPATTKPLDLPTHRVGFAAEVVPLVTRLGCNSGSCHGRKGGQDGFALSLFGSDHTADWLAMTSRVDCEDQASSLLFLKPTAQLPHGGGERLKLDSSDYQTLVRWAEQVDLTHPPPVEVGLVRLNVIPELLSLTPQACGQLQVQAIWQDGSVTDATHLSQFASTATATLTVSPTGRLLAGRFMGEASVVVRYAGQVGVARVSVPSGCPLPDLDLATESSIDRLVNRRLGKLGLMPSALATDREFARRSSLDICGILPKPAEVLAYEQDHHPEKRTRWIDGLLTRPEYADYFACQWSAIFRNRRSLGDRSKPSTFAFHGWLRQAIGENWSYDRLVRAIVAGCGDARTNPGISWYRHVASLEERTDDIAQMFLGTRIGCARCHHHPTERWGQDDYLAFSSFLARVGTKAGNDPNSFQVFNLARNPRPVASAPRNLGARSATNFGPQDDPRVGLMAWMVEPANPYFARAVVNRYWKHFLGVGIVEPVDDLRASNPPTNPELLDDLSNNFRSHQYDLKWLVRSITTSATYARSSLPHPANPPEQGNFARFTPKRLSAEALSDAIDLVTGTSAAYQGVPPGTRATQLPDDGFVASLLDTFGRPARQTACACERVNDPSLAQALWLLNSQELESRVAHPTGRAALFDQPADARTDATKVGEIYELALARLPSPDELKRSLDHLDHTRRLDQDRAGYEDLIWALLNTKEFLYNH